MDAQPLRAKPWFSELFIQHINLLQSHKTAPPRKDFIDYRRRLIEKSPEHQLLVVSRTFFIWLNLFFHVVYRSISLDFRLLRQRWTRSNLSGTAFRGFFRPVSLAYLPLAFVYACTRVCVCVYVSLSQTIPPTVSRGCSLTEYYILLRYSVMVARRDGRRDSKERRQQTDKRRGKRREKKREEADCTIARLHKRAKKRNGKRSFSDKSKRKKENETERGSDTESEREEDKTEREGKRIGTTSPVSSSSILRKSPPKMAGCARRVRERYAWHRVAVVPLSSNVTARNVIEGYSRVETRDAVVSQEK